MSKMKVDERIRKLIECGIEDNHRTMFVIFGNKANSQVPYIFTMMATAAGKSPQTVLWVSKKDLLFSSDQRKRTKQIEKMKKSGRIVDDDMLALFQGCTQINHCYYKDTTRVLGTTYDMCVLQDFEAVTPSHLARTVETVRGGGAVVILLQSVNTVEEFNNMVMDVHSRYRTESSKEVIGRFNERFLLSLADCPNCIALNDQLEVVPFSTKNLCTKSALKKSLDDTAARSRSPELEELAELRQQLKQQKETDALSAIIGCCKTLDQAKAVMRFYDAILEKSSRSTVSMTAARGRGKSAALGLAMALAVADGYSNIYVTAPSPENLRSMFDFIHMGFDALKYKEHQDYETIQSDNPEFMNAIVRIDINRKHRQIIQYIHPTDAHKMGHAELVCIDEAAAIPLPLVQALLGPHVVFMSSTVNGYEGTGRSLSHKLLKTLREKSSAISGAGVELTVKRIVDKVKGKEHSNVASLAGRSLYELTLTESIRYKGGDGVEQWLTDLLCLDVSDMTRTAYGSILPDKCELVYVNRDTLFSNNRGTELFLRRLVSIYVASHYKNTPDDLQLLSDNPAHHLFCLIRPVEPDTTQLPDVYCVIQVCLEGQIPRETIVNNLSRGERPSGDLIPWTVSQQFLDPDFGGKRGARIVRIATHPDLQAQGYGKRAMELLQTYYEGRMPCMSEEKMDTTQTSSVKRSQQGASLMDGPVKPRDNLPPLLQLLSNRSPERLDYLGVSYGLTSELLRFWTRHVGMMPVYLRQTPNELTGEHTCIVLKKLSFGEEAETSNRPDLWLETYRTEFRRRFVSLLSFDCFRGYRPALALDLLYRAQIKEKIKPLSAHEVSSYLTGHDLNRLDKYVKNLIDYHLITDLLPTLAEWFFLNRIDVKLQPLQIGLLLGMGLQYKSIDALRLELDVKGELQVSQMLIRLTQLVRSLLQSLNSVLDKAVENEMGPRKEISMEPLAQPLDKELADAAREIEAKQKEEKTKALQELTSKALGEYAIRGTEKDWADALKTGKQGIVSVKGEAKKRKLLEHVKELEEEKSGKKKKVPTATLR